MNSFDCWKKRYTFIRLLLILLSLSVCFRIGLICFSFCSSISYSYSSSIINFKKICNSALAGSFRFDLLKTNIFFIALSFQQKPLLSIPYLSLILFFQYLLLHYLLLLPDISFVFKLLKSRLIYLCNFHIYFLTFDDILFPFLTLRLLIELQNIMEIFLANNC